MPFGIEWNWRGIDPHGGCEDVEQNQCYYPQTNGAGDSAIASEDALSIVGSAGDCHG
jgi:hypothetical protein